MCNVVKIYVGKTEWCKNLCCKTECGENKCCKIHV